MIDPVPSSPGAMPQPRAEPLTREGAIRVVGLCLLGFVLMVGYAITRPATESLFIADHGAESLPKVWILVGITAALVTAVFSRAVKGRELARLLAGTCVVSSIVLAVLIFSRKAMVPFNAYLLYSFKDVYVVVLVETFWAFANAVFPFNTARWSYGLFCVAGSLGHMAGNVGIGPLAKQLGTEDALWLAIPFFLLAGLIALLLSKFAGAAVRQSKIPPSVVEGIKLVGKSRYLWLVLLLIGLVQVVITLIDFSTNQFIAANWTGDERTAVIGQIYAAVDVVSIVLQLGTGLVLRALGVTGTLLAVPLVLGGALALFLLVPRFALMAVAKVASKAMDYSVFRAAKEMLYLPLSYAEKTQGKAVVDVMTYRVAKAATSGLLLVLVELSAAGRAVVALALALCGLWGAVVWQIRVRYRSLLDDAKESEPKVV